MSENMPTNRLIHEKSPYLLQHAHNPVDWYPWGAEAFETARKNDKPIFLSIGYSTCHWCHAMEKESFDNHEIAKLLNQAFVNIKVDREELPEVDSLYMEFAQSMMAGAAGWPLNVILTPKLKPFFATTYLPPDNSKGMIGIKELIARIQEVWNGPERERVESQAEKVVEVFSDSIHTVGEQLPGPHLVDEAIDLFYKMADPIWGGLKGLPKFPLGYQINFLVRYAALRQDSRALYLVEKTLEMMRRGGIYDHLGGGFSRYSTDEEWQIPHFEKMLYDNALLIDSYTEAYQATKNPEFKEIAEHICDYILREMTHLDGGFYSAQDADSKEGEGYFYTWTKEEIKEILGPKNAKEFCAYYDVKPRGNFAGRNILHTPLSIKEFAEAKNLDSDELAISFAQSRQKLWDAREKRDHPLKDDKILTSWNGLAIHSLAKAGAILQRPRYLDAAEKGARFIQSKLWYDGRFYRRFRDGDVGFSAGLEEYAFFIRALITLFETGGDSGHLLFAMELADTLSSTFKEPDGAFYQTDGRDENLILRRCHLSDGAEPSGNSIHCENLLRLYQLTGQRRYLDEAEDVLRAVARMIETYAPGYVYHLMNLLRYYDKEESLALVALNEEQDGKDEIFKIIYSNYVPHRQSLFRKLDDDPLLHRIPFLSEQCPQGDKTTLYLCKKGVCQEPVSDMEKIRQILGG